MDTGSVKTTVGAETEFPKPIIASGEMAGVSVDEVAVPSPAKVGGGSILDGKGINAVIYAQHGASNRMPSETEVFLGIAQQMYESLKAIVDNLKPSEKEKENLRRRQEEIRKLREELQNRKIDLEQARIQFINMLDHDDVAEFARQADRANAMIRS